MTKSVALTVIKIGEQRYRQTEETHQYIGHGQVDDEVVGERVHVRRAVDDGDDEHVARQAEDEDERVGERVDDDHVKRLA